MSAWFQHDGAPPHFGRNAREFLRQFPQRWIGRGGPISWLPRSPDALGMHSKCIYYYFQYKWDI